MMKPALLGFLVAAVAAVPPLQSGVNRPEQQQKPHVVLVSFDGLGAQMLNGAEAPNFRRLMRQGVRAESLIPVFPSSTFPNHYTIVTGQYPERHGIVQMQFFDPARGKAYSYQDEHSVTDGSWYGGEPIWVTAEKQGMVSAACYWVGSEAAIQGVRPSHWRKYTDNLSNQTRVETVLEWLRMPDESRPHLITLYFSAVDGAGHRFGPQAPETREAIKQADQLLGSLLDGVEALDIRDSVYVVVVSDHGMTQVSREQVIPVDGLLDVQGLEGRGAGNQMSFWVKEGPARARQIRDEINSKIQHGKAYLREEIPERLHHRADPRIGDVVILMDEPWRILPPRGGTRDMTVLGGWHGWDPASEAMRGIFLAMGPGIRKGATIPAFENIHIYPLLAELLALSPAQGIDGKPGMLRDQILEPPIALTGVNVVDVARGDTLPNRSVVIEAGRIASVGGAIPANARVIAADGLYVIPGLWDMHVHLRSASRRPEAPLVEENSSFLDLFLPHGVVGIREMGGDLADTVLRWRDEIRQGKRIGPRILTAGRKIDGVPPSWPGSLAVKTPEEGRAAVRQMKQAGVDFIKTYFSRVELPVLQAVTDEAHKNNLRVTGHWPFNLPVQLLPESGMDAIEHADSLVPRRQDEFAAFQREIEARRGTPWELRRGQEEFWARQLYMRDSAHADSFYRALAAKSVWVTPTLFVQRTLLVDNPGRDLSNDPRAQFIFPAIWQTWDTKAVNRSAPPQGRIWQLMAEHTKQSQQVVTDAHRAGVPMIAGSDCGANNNYVFPGWSLHDELELLVEAGISAPDALRMATINAARWRGDADREGTVEVGKAAELVLLRANPLERISNTREVESVIRAGRYYSRADLDKMLADVELRVRAARQK